MAEQLADVNARGFPREPLLEAQQGAKDQRLNVWSVGPIVERGGAGAGGMNEEAKTERKVLMRGAW